MGSAPGSCSRPGSASTTRAWGTSIPTAQPASRRRLDRSGSLRLAGSFQALDVRFDHDLRGLLELGLRLPSEDPLGLPRVPPQVVDLRSSDVLLVARTMRLPSVES